MTKFKVRIVYKSGYTHDFWCTKFKYHPDTQTFTWASVNPKNQPVVLGAPEITAVYQVGIRRSIKEWFNKLFGTIGT